MIHAKIKTKDGHSHELDHWLRFQDPVIRGSSPISPETIASDLNVDFPEPLTVFVSYSRADSPVFQTLRHTLEPRGLKVVTADAARAGQPSEREIKSLIGSAHAVVALLSDEPSRWVLEEIAEAERQNVTVIPVLLGNADLPTNLASLQPLRIQNPGDPDQTLGFLKEQLAKLGL